MLIRVLGSAAGGGFPQWNCNSPASRAAWAGAAPARTQSSVAVSSDGARWLVLNASPDIRQQIAACKHLQPDANGAARNSPIGAIALTGCEVDNIAGLLSVRERQPFVLYATQQVFDVIAANPIFNVLGETLVGRVKLEMEHCIAITDTDRDLGLAVTPFPVPGKLALFLEDADSDSSMQNCEGCTIGLKVSERETGRYFCYVPACSQVDSLLRDRLRGAPLVLFDGTLYSDDELIRQGLGTKTGQRMGHISMSGGDGSLSALRGLDIERQIYLHINTSNPVLIEGSPERSEVERAGWEIAEDGMEIVL